MPIGDLIIKDLRLLLSSWDFANVDALGRIGSLIIRWNTNLMLCINRWAINLVLGIVPISCEMGLTFQIVNIYGPYHNRVSLWENIYGS